MSFACERVLERLSPFLDRELPDPEVLEIRDHLAVCPPCGGAHRRLARLETISIEILRCAPVVGPAEWGARWSFIDGQALNPKVIALRERRERSVRRVAVRFAVAAALLVAATLALPLLHSRIHEAGVDHPSSLAYNHTPGANEGEILESWTDSENHWVEVESNDPVVILVSKL